MSHIFTTEQEREIKRLVLEALQERAQQVIERKAAA